jgi:hypothetical protein
MLGLDTQCVEIAAKYFGSTDYKVTDGTTELFELFAGFAEHAKQMRPA